MPEIIRHSSSILHRRKGVALLMVLLIVFAITIISLGFLTRCDTELACGQNMLLRTQMDQLADSALEHARGLTLHPQDIAGEYWTGGAGQQLMSDGSDYYDVSVVRDSSDPDDHCTYQITCEAYRLQNARKTGRSRLFAELRLDPCIALWSGADLMLRPSHSLHGDLYCAGAVTNSGAIDGDVFSTALTGTITGCHRPAADLSLTWPPVTTTYVNPEYSTSLIGVGTVAATTYSPATIWKRSGDLTIGGNVSVEGMLLVEGNLTIGGTGNSITAAKNLPALYVRGDLILKEVDGLTIEGLAVVEGNVRISAAASNIRILGGLFTKGTLAETASDSSGGNSDCLVYGAASWLPAGGPVQGAMGFDGVDDSLRTSDSPTSLQLTGDYTISVWVRPAATQKAGAGLVAKTDPSASVTHWSLQFDAGNPAELRVCHPTGNWQTNITLSDLTADAQWHHVAVVRQGNTMSSYLDGSRRRQDTWSVGPGFGGGHLNVAADSTARPEYLYAGLMDDLRIYNLAVDAGNIPPSDGLPGLIGHWKFDESGSDVIITAGPTRSAIVVWLPGEDPPEAHWSQAAGAFFRSIRRN
jgi:hypothetical protein